VVAGSPAGDAAVITLVSPERAALVQRRNASTVPELWQALDAVKDPEIPAVSLWDLGILQDVVATPTGVRVIITPTYSGCPAMAHMEQDIIDCLHRVGVTNVEVITRLAPAWSTDWLDQQARCALREYGIAPPAKTQVRERPQAVQETGREGPLVRLQRVQVQGVEVFQGRAQGDHLGDGWGPGLELPGHVVEDDALGGDLADHLAATQEGLHLLQQVRSGPGPCGR